MKRLSLYLFLILFTLPTPSQADDIRDFQIEGMSIGESLLDYYSESKIKSSSQNYYKKKDYIPVWIKDSKYEIYDGVQFHYKKTDKKYKISNIEGIIYYTKNIKDCYQKLNEIDEEFLKFFPNAERVDQGMRSHGQDKTGKSKVKSINYFFKSGDNAYVWCLDWTKKMGYDDHLRVGLKTDDINKWFGTAY